jgi:hypothetical protein
VKCGMEIDRKHSNTFLYNIFVSQIFRTWGQSRSFECDQRSVILQTLKAYLYDTFGTK